jgi:hypothetical protein
MQTLVEQEKDSGGKGEKRDDVKDHRMTHERDIFMNLKKFHN